jgi:hypothetical protein
MSRLDTVLLRIVMFARSPGAELENVLIYGCNGTAVRIAIDDNDVINVREPRPVVLRNIHITGCTSRGSAVVEIGGNAHVLMECCNITDNTADDSVVDVASGSKLIVVNSTFSSGNGTSIVLYGSTLHMLRSQFCHNAAENGGAVRIACGASTGASAQATCDNTCEISDTSFVRNHAGSRGGAVFMMGGSSINVSNTRFVDNTAIGVGGAMSLAGVTQVHMNGALFGDYKVRAHAHCCDRHM